MEYYIFARQKIPSVKNCKRKITPFHFVAKMFVFCFLGFFSYGFSTLWQNIHFSSEISFVLELVDTSVYLWSLCYIINGIQPTLRWSLMLLGSRLIKSRPSIFTTCQEQTVWNCLHANPNPQLFYRVCIAILWSWNKSKYTCLNSSYNWVFVIRFIYLNRD